MVSLPVVPLTTRLPPANVTTVGAVVKEPLATSTLSPSAVPSGALPWAGASRRGAPLLRLGRPRGPPGPPVVAGFRAWDPLPAVAVLSVMELLRTVRAPPPATAMPPPRALPPAP